MIDGVLHTPYQYTEAQLAAAVEEAHRLGTFVAVHAMGEPGTLYAAQAGVASIDHATQLSDETMRLMREKGIFAVPTFTIFEYFATHRESQDQAAAESAMLDYKIAEFKKQIAAGVPFAVGSDVGPFPHGTQARELTLMVRYGMKPLAVLQADMINGAKLLGWDGQIGELKPGYYADIVAVPGNPLDDITRGGACELCDEERRGGAAVSRVAECTLICIQNEKLEIPTPLSSSEESNLPRSSPYALLCSASCRLAS